MNHLPLLMRDTPLMRYLLMIGLLLGAIVPATAEDAAAEPFHFFLRAVRREYIPFVLKEMKVVDPADKSSWYFVLQDRGTDPEATADGPTKRYYIGDTVGDTGYSVVDARSEVAIDPRTGGTVTLKSLVVKKNDLKYVVPLETPTSAGPHILEFYVVEQATLNEGIAQAWEDSVMEVADSQQQTFRFQVPKIDVTELKDRGTVRLQPVDADGNKAGKPIFVLYISAKDYDLYMAPYRELKKKREQAPGN